MLQLGRQARAVDPAPSQGARAGAVLAQRTTARTSSGPRLPAPLCPSAHGSAPSSARARRRPELRSRAGARPTARDCPEPSTLARCESEALRSAAPCSSAATCRNGRAATSADSAAIMAPPERQAPCGALGLAMRRHGPSTARMVPIVGLLPWTLGMDSRAGLALWTLELDSLSILGLFPWTLGPDSGIV